MTLYSVLQNLILVLPSPEFNNSEKLEFTRINRKSRGGSLTIFRDPIWPKSDTLTIPLLLKDCSLEQTKSNLIYFLKQTLGQNITLTDYRGHVWQGIITNPQVLFTQSGKDRYTINLEFLGIRI